MPIIGEAAINLVANTRPLATGLGQVAGIVRRSLAPVTAIVGAASAALGGFGIGFGLRLAGEMEQAEVAFGVMLGSADKAKKMLADINTFAANTPFSFPGIVDSTKTLLNFGISGDSVLGTIDMLSNVAAGNEERMKSLALTYGQVSSAGKLMGQDLLQFINAGFNPLQEISKKTGESMASLKDRMSKGELGIDDVRKAFELATSEGGMFYQMNIKQSRTLLGLWSTFKDNAAAQLRGVGQVLIEELDLKDALASLSDNAQSFGDVIIPVFRSSIRWAVAFADGVKNIASSTMDWYDDNRTLIGGIAGTAAAIAAVVLGISVYTTSIGVLGTALMALATSPIALVVAGIGSIAVAFAYVNGVGGTVIERLANGFKVLGIGIGKTFQNSQTMMATWSRSMSAANEQMTSVWIKGTGELDRLFISVTGDIETTWYDVLASLTDGWKKFTDLIRSPWLAEKLAWIAGKMQGLSDKEIKQHIDATLSANFDDEINSYAKTSNAFKQQSDNARKSTLDKLSNSRADQGSNLSNLEKMREQNDKKYIEQLANANGTFFDDLKGLFDKLGLPDIGMIGDNFKAAIAKAVGDIPEPAGFSVGSVDTTIGSSKQSQKIQTVGLTDMFNRIQTAISPTKDPSQKTADNTKVVADETKKSNTKLDKLHTVLSSIDKKTATSVVGIGFVQ